MLLIVCFVILWIVDLFFLPVQDAPGEIQTVWFILVVPNVIKTAAFYSLVGFLIITPIWINFRLYKDAVLTFLPDAIFLKGKSILYTLPIDRIKKISCMDSTDANGFPKGKLTIYFLQKRRRKVKEWIVRVRLKDYSEIDLFMEHLIKYEGLEIKVYDTDITPDADKEI